MVGALNYGCQVWSILLLTFASDSKQQFPAMNPAKKEPYNRIASFVEDSKRVEKIFGSSRGEPFDQIGKNRVWEKAVSPHIETHPEDLVLPGRRSHEFPSLSCSGVLSE